MYPFLKTLLLSTTGLIAGETFAAAPEGGLSEIASIVDTVEAVGKYERAGDLNAAAKVYADYAMRPEVLWFHVLFSTKNMERLQRFEQAIELFKWSKTQANTQYFARKAESEIVRLTQAQAEHTAKIAQEICSIIAGDSDLLDLFQKVISEILPEGFFFRTAEYKLKELTRILIEMPSDKLNEFETSLKNLDRKTPDIHKLIRAVEKYKGNVPHTPDVVSAAPVDSIPGAHDVAASSVILKKMNELRAIQGDIPDTKEAYDRVIGAISAFKSDTTQDICEYINEYGIFLIPTGHQKDDKPEYERMDAIDKESDPVHGIPLSEILIRVWTFAENLDDEKDRNDLKKAIYEEISSAASNMLCLQAYTTNLIGIVFPYLDRDSETNFIDSGVPPFVPTVKDDASSSASLTDSDDYSNIRRVHDVAASIPGAHDVAASGVILENMTVLRAIQGKVPDIKEAYDLVISEIKAHSSLARCIYIQTYGRFILPVDGWNEEDPDFTPASATDKESDIVYGIPLSEILIRMWTFATRLKDLETSELLKNLICNAIFEAERDMLCLQAYTTNIVSVIVPFLDLEISETAPTPTPHSGVGAIAAPTVNDDASASASLTDSDVTSRPVVLSSDIPAPTTAPRAGAGARPVPRARIDVPASAENKDRYTRMYLGLQERWKIVAMAEDNLQSFFFHRGIERLELTSTAVLELMYKFLMDHPEIHIPDLENFGLFTVAEYNTTTHAVTIPQIEQLKQKLLNQALAAFAKGQKLYATIVQVGGAGSGHYTVVVIEHDGKVHMINTMGAFASDSKSDPYAYIMPKLVEALNIYKEGSPIVFKAASNVRTGIQDADALSNSCGIYSFVYWAALMMTQDINAYKRVTAAAAEGYLGEYADILRAAKHKNQIDVIVQVADPSKANEFGIEYFKNPSAEIQAKFEKEIRALLQKMLMELSQR